MFAIEKILNGRQNVPPTMTMPATADVNYVQGTMLKLTDGGLTLCGASDKPEFIALETKKGFAGDKVLVSKVDGNIIFRTSVSAAPAALKTGDKVTLTSDASGVTATTTSGVATIFDLNEATVTGDSVLVTFN